MNKIKLVKYSNNTYRLFLPPEFIKMLVDTYQPDMLYTIPDEEIDFEEYKE